MSKSSKRNKFLTYYHKYFKYPASFQSLQVLNLSGNKFAGSLPKSLSCLVSLRQIKLYNNQLEGQLPDVFSTCTALEEVNLSQNLFKGDPLEVFARCLSLKRLNLAYNRFDEDLNSSMLSGMTSLELLYLNHNQITGRIGPEICLLKGLKLLNVSNNRLIGMLPSAFGDLTRLEVCVMSANEINGPVPASMSQLINLKDFHIFSQWPSEAHAVSREFKSYTYHRLYTAALQLGLDTLCWKEYGMPAKGGKKQKHRKEISADV